MLNCMNLVYYFIISSGIQPSTTSCHIYQESSSGKYIYTIAYNICHVIIIKIVNMCTKDLEQQYRDQGLANDRYITIIH